MEGGIETILAGVFAKFTLVNLLWLLLGYSTLPFLYQIIYYRFIHPLKHYPGPFWGTVTRLWQTYYNYNQTELETYEELFKETKAPVLRVSPTLLLVNSATALPLIYHRTAVKSKFYSNGAFGEAVSVFNIRDHQLHAHRRRTIASPYSKSNILKSEPLVDVVISAWLAKLNILFVETQRPVDMAKWAVYVAFDIISKVGFGEALGFVEKAEDVGGLIESIHEGAYIFGLMARLWPFVEWATNGPLRRYLTATPEMKTGMGQLMRWRNKLIDSRLTEIEEGQRRDRVDLLQSFLEAKSPKGEPLNRSELEAEVLLVLAGGADTTGTSFGSLLTDIFSSPNVYARMMKEIDEGFASGNLSQPIPTAAEVSQHCPFYVSCVKESIRLCPSSPAIFPREVTADQPPLIIDGKVIPVGTEITCSPYLANRDRELYGEDAGTFRPERWLEDPEKSKMFDKYNYTFGYGSRGCLGKDLAMMELMKTPLMFFRTFNFEMCARSKETPGPPKRVIWGGLFHWEDIWLNLQKRKV